MMSEENDDRDGRIPPGFSEDQWFGNGKRHDEIPDEHFWFVCDCGERFNDTDAGLDHMKSCDEYEWPGGDEDDA